MIVPGNEQSASDRTANIYATAKLPDAIDNQFGMHDMNALLGKFRLFGEDFDMNYDQSNARITISDDYAKVVVPTSDIKTIAMPKIGGSIGSDVHDINFTITSANLNKMVDFMKVNGTDTVAFSKRDEDNYIRIEGYIFDNVKENSLRGMKSEPVWFLRIKEADQDMESFKYYMRLGWKILDADYNVTIKQFIGMKQTSPENTDRMPAIQFDSENIRYITVYLNVSENQKGLHNVNA